MTRPAPPRPLAGLDDEQRAMAMRRWAVLRPHLEDGVLLAVAAREVGVPLRTAQRWLARYRAEGLVGLVRTTRNDHGQRWSRPSWSDSSRAWRWAGPGPSVATIARRVARVAAEQGWPVPSYSTVHAIVAGLDPHLLTLAHDGPVALPPGAVGGDLDAAHDARGEVESQHLGCAGGGTSGG